MWASYRTLSDFTHTIPGYVHTMLVQQLDHALPSPLTRITQYFQYSLKFGAPEFKAVAKHMYFSTTYICIDFNTRDEIHIQSLCCLHCLFQSISGIVVRQGQYS